ncbi:MAG: ATPase domain-containing protein [Thermoplasmata archaeon]|nr:ATPase domain-containing protein [Thermoplasmata archaeon]
MRVKTGINGLDELAEGGFPDRTVNLLSGPAGSAKSLFCMQYVHRGAVDYGDVGIYITLEESRDNVLRAAKAYGMDLQSLEKNGKIYLLDFGEIRTEVDMGEELNLGIVSFANLRDLLEKMLNKTGARRLVIDSISAIGLYYGNQEELRREMFAFCRFLKNQDVTSILITEAVENLRTRFDVEQFLADSIISLGYENVGGEYRRTITIYKMRFTRHEPYKHPFLITKSGIEIDHEEIIY